MPINLYFIFYELNVNYYVLCVTYDSRKILYNEHGGVKIFHNSKNKIWHFTKHAFVGIISKKEKKIWKLIIQTRII